MTPSNITPNRHHGQALTVHGWIYGVHDGLLRDLRMTVAGPGELSARHADALRNLSAPASS